jgi:hypothetical protein
VSVGGAAAGNGAHGGGASAVGSEDATPFSDNELAVKVVPADESGKLAPSSAADVEATLGRNASGGLVATGDTGETATRTSTRIRLTNAAYTATQLNIDTKWLREVLTR